MIDTSHHNPEIRKAAKRLLGALRLWEFTGSEIREILAIVVDTTCTASEEVSADEFVNAAKIVARAQRRRVLGEEYTSNVQYNDDAE